MQTIYYFKRQIRLQFCFDLVFFVECYCFTCNRHLFIIVFKDLRLIFLIEDNNVKIGVRIVRCERRRISCFHFILHRMWTLNLSELFAIIIQSNIIESFVIVKNTRHQTKCKWQGSISEPQTLLFLTIRKPYYCKIILLRWICYCKWKLSNWYNVVDNR